MNIREQLNLYVNEYKDFMEIEQFPEYTLQTKQVSINVADLQGFDSVAAAFYQPLTGEHTLVVSTNLVLSQYVMFHEFTHIYDSEQYANGDKIRYLGLSGYTEYHASQAELAHLLGAITIKDVPSFSMNTTISTYGNEVTVARYVQNKYQHAIALFSRTDFPANINTLKSAFGVLYNYWGLRSICEMYATDFVETIDNTAFLKYIPTITFSRINNLMHGWLDETEINSSIPLYVNAIIPIAQQYKLS